MCMGASVAAGSGQVAYYIGTNLSHEHSSGTWDNGICQDLRRSGHQAWPIMSHGLEQPVDTSQAHSIADHAGRNT